MNHKTHSFLMIGFLVAGAVLFFSGGVSGGALFLLWPLACVAMMVVMMRGMGAMSGKPGEHTHDDGMTHSHSEVPAQTRK